MVNPIRDNSRGVIGRGKISNGADIRERVSLISGTDFSQRQHAAENIKKRILRGKDPFLNVLTFYGKEVNPEDLRRKLFTTSFGKERIVIFKNFQDLPSAVSKFLFDNLKRILSDNYLIFETDKDYYQFQKDKRFTNDEFFVLVLKKAALFRVVSTKGKATVDDFIASLRKNDLAAAVYILEKLFSGGSKDRMLGPQIVGILVRKFSFLSAAARRDPASGGKNPTEKDRYFKYLWEADRAIKEKGLDPRLIIELLLARVLGPQ